MPRAAITNNGFSDFERPSEDDPIINASANIVIHPQDVPRYGEDAWSLHFWVALPTSNLMVIHWGEVPSLFVNDLKLLAWSLLNKPISAAVLADLMPMARPLPGMSSYYRAVGVWKDFAKHLTSRGVNALSDASIEDLETFALGLKKRSYGTGRSTLTALTRLWIHLQMVGLQPFEEPPWIIDGYDDHISKYRTRLENTTPPIPTKVLGPLLTSALHFIEDAAEDVVRLRSEQRRVSEQVAQNKPHLRGAGAGLIRQYALSLAESGRSLPTMTYLGRTVWDTEIIARDTGLRRGYVQNWFMNNYSSELLVSKNNPMPMVGGLTLRDREGRRDVMTVFRGEVDSLVKHLETACLIVILYLTGMRPGEVLGLRRGCLRASDDPNVHWMFLEAITTKTARDQAGRHDPRGQIRETPWVAIKPVQDAIRAIESLRDGDLLFPAQRRRSSTVNGALRDETLRRHIHDFVDWNNARTDSGAIPIPPEPKNRLSASRFRRTLAWHIANEPEGLVALSIQYGHILTATSEAYGNRSHSDLRELVDEELLHASVDHYRESVKARARGEKVSGGGADDFIATIDPQSTKYRGLVMTERQLRDLKEDPDVRLYPGMNFTCNFNPLLAACLDHTESLMQEKDAYPRREECVPSCQNWSMVDSQAESRGERAAAMLDDLALNSYPAPFVEDMTALAQRDLDLVRRHQREAR